MLNSVAVAVTVSAVTVFVWGACTAAWTLGLA